MTWLEVFAAMASGHVSSRGPIKEQQRKVPKKPDRFWDKLHGNERNRPNRHISSSQPKKDLKLEVISPYTIYSLKDILKTEKVWIRSMHRIMGAMKEIFKKISELLMQTPGKSCQDLLEKKDQIESF